MGDFWKYHGFWAEVRRIRFGSVDAFWWVKNMDLMKSFSANDF